MKLVVCSTVPDILPFFKAESGPDPPSEGAILGKGVTAIKYRDFLRILP